MANTLTLTDLAPTIYAARDQVAREAVGAINSVTITRDGQPTAAFGDQVQSFVTGKPTLNESYTPAMSIPSADDVTVDGPKMTLDKVANTKLPLTGETSRRLDNTFGVDVVLRALFAQSFRVITNAIEVYLCTILYKGSSRATGTAGTTPFASNFGELALLRQILQDNGCPVNDGMLSSIVSTAAGANLRQLAQLQKVNESGSDATLRRGELLNLQGFSLKESAGIATHTKGTGSGYLIDLVANYPAGSTTVHVDTGTGTILPGDIVTVADDPAAGKYVVSSGFAGDGDGDITLGSPGARGLLSNNKALAIGNGYTANLGLHMMAAELAVRAPAQPYGGDAAVDRLTLSDEATGISFEVAQYKGYGMAMFDITAFYGAKVWHPYMVATLMG
jgi:hypothetical protein